MSLCIASSSGSGATRICGVWTRLMLSTPPPIATSMLSTMICLAAVAIAIRPDAHWRSSDMPDTVVGRPARSSDSARDVAGLMPLLERGAEHHVVDLGAVDPGALDRGLDRVAGERGRGQVVERAAIGAADRGAGGGDDDGGTHGKFSCRKCGTAMR